MLRSKSEELVAKETEGEFLGEISKEAANLIPRGVSITQKELDKVCTQKKRENEIHDNNVCIATWSVGRTRFI